VPKRRRNPNTFTTDEAQTATLAFTEGTAECIRSDKIAPKRWRYSYPYISIRTCKRDALLSAQRAFNVPIGADRFKRISCPPEDFPPDGRGEWRVRIPYKHIQKLKPLIPKTYIERWEKTFREKGCPPR